MKVNYIIILVMDYNFLNPLGTLLLVILEFLISKELGWCFWMTV